MKIVFDRDYLTAVLTPLMGAVAGKNTNAAIEGILIETTDDKTVVLSAYDMEKGVRATISACVEEGGSFIVNAQKLNSIIRTMPEGAVTLEVNDKFITSIRSGKSSFELHAMKGTDFPNLPNLTIDKGIKLKQRELKEMITAVMFAVAQNDPRPELNGAFFRMEGKRLTVVSCDSNRLAIKEKNCEIETVSMEEEEISMRFIVPSKSLNELMRLLGDTDDVVTMKVTHKHLILYCGDICLFTRLIEEEYIDYERFLPKTEKLSVTVDCEAVIGALERASLVTEDKTMGQAKSPLICNFRDDVLILKSNSVTGSFIDEIPIEKQGDDLDIYFNCRKLLDAFRACDCERVRLSLTTALMSVVIVPVEENEDEKFLFLVLPIRGKE